MGNSRAKFIRPMMAVLPAPKTDDLETYVTVYANMLDVYDDAVLVRAADNLLRKIKVKSMPVPADCLEACDEAAQMIEVEKRRAMRPPKRESADDWDNHIADDLIKRCEFAKQACEEDWQIALWDWIAKNKRLPNNFEAEDIKIKGWQDRASWKEISGNKFGMQFVHRAVMNKSARIKRIIHGDNEANAGNVSL